MTMKDALFIGVCQSIAICPGISRQFGSYDGRGTFISF